MLNEQYDKIHRNQIQSNIESIAEEVIGFVPKQKGKESNIQFDREIENMSKEQRDLKIRLENCTNVEKKIVLKTK